MIGQAGERIYVCVSGPVLESILPELDAAVLRGIKVVAITDGERAPGGASVYRTGLPPHQIRLITDSASVLTGDIADGEDSTCLFSMKKNLIDLFKDSLKNEIKLIELERGSAHDEKAVCDTGEAQGDRRGHPDAVSPL
jgi:hypothetical protein